MRIEIYDTALNRKAILYSWVSMLWQPEYNGLGLFLVEFQESSDLFGYISTMDYVKLDIDDTVMMVTSVQMRDGKVVVSGRSANFILYNRVSDTVISNQNAEAAMRSLVQNMNPWDCLELGDSAGLTDIYTAQTSDARISEYCTNICTATDMGYRIIKSGRKLLFECYKPPLNTGLKFSARLGNIGNEQYAESENDYANVAIVAGAGEGAARVTVIAGDTSLTGVARREIYVDARSEQPEEGESDSEYRARLVRYGEKRLAELYRIKNITFAISDDRVKLGDLVPVTSSLTGETYTARITALSIKSQKNTIKRTISVGTPIPLKRRS